MNTDVVALGREILSGKQEDARLVIACAKRLWFLAVAFGGGTRRCGGAEGAEEEGDQDG